MKLYDPATNAYDIPAVNRQSNVATTQTTSGSRGLNKGSAILNAFERVGLVRTLAEPDLTAVSGEAGQFLVGGEFPVPVGQDNTGKVTIDFKQYGVGLGYTPVVLSKGRISLKTDRRGVGAVQHRRLHPFQHQRPIPAAPPRRRRWSSPA